MELFRDLLYQDPATPRLTVYTEATGARMDFSATTLDNWAAKVANMLLEELDLTEDSRLLIDLPVGWQAAAIAFGALAAGVDFSLDPSLSVSDPGDVDVVFCSPERAGDHPGPDLVVVTSDPFGRGVEETGGTLGEGWIDFGLTVRFYGDTFAGSGPALADLVSEAEREELAGARALATGWTNDAGFARQVLAPLAAGGSVVIVAGFATAGRMDHIAEVERVTVRL
ncbi:hypothetical protein CATYP_02690 [Corynebacterium atypicum]|uniref:TIGR03089 family protein n=1 Tax=Corynebacterium atypicum TaxID=191610 RepID=A0ABN4DBU6_9CORY|nr:TIGR03089 family protein [Corynebacterium atypicum]AIG63768.1 hypothetical protein CATYP_02690 [Corynebacterium atypicum]